jgi:hypothetical protein
MICSSTAKPEGGFRLISVVQICAVWTAYHAKLIGPGDLRVWFAAQEMVARRCLCSQEGTTHFLYDHRIAATDGVVSEIAPTRSKCYGNVTRCSGLCCR